MQIKGNEERFLDEILGLVKEGKVAINLTTDNISDEEYVSKYNFNNYSVSVDESDNIFYNTISESVYDKEKTYPATRERLLEDMKKGFLKLQVDEYKVHKCSVNNRGDSMKQRQFSLFLGTLDDLPENTAISFKASSSDKSIGFSVFAFKQGDLYYIWDAITGRFKLSKTTDITTNEHLRFAACCFDYVSIEKFSYSFKEDNVNNVQQYTLSSDIKEKLIHICNLTTEYEKLSSEAYQVIYKCPEVEKVYVDDTPNYSGNDIDTAMEIARDSAAGIYMRKVDDYTDRAKNKVKQCSEDIEYAGSVVFLEMLGLPTGRFSRNLERYSSIHKSTVPYDTLVSTIIPSRIQIVQDLMQQLQKYIDAGYYFTEKEQEPYDECEGYEEYEDYEEEITQAPVVTGFDDCIEDDDDLPF